MQIKPVIRRDTMPSWPRHGSGLKRRVFNAVRMFAPFPKFVFGTDAGILGRGISVLAKEPSPSSLRLKIYHALPLREAVVHSRVSGSLKRTIQPSPGRRIRMFLQWVETDRFRSLVAHSCVANTADAIVSTLSRFSGEGIRTNAWT